MNWTRVAAVTLTAVALAATMLALTGSSFEGRQTATRRAKRVERGKYLVTICGCGDCHTPGTFYGAPDFARQLSGSELGWQGPWGVSYARNLTPDQETGLGKWSDADIIKSFRSGVRPDGSTLLPPMPWQDLSALTDEDATSIVAYLRGLPPVAHKVPDRIPPGQPGVGSIVVFPPPSAWDAPRTPAEGAPAKP